MKKIPNFFIVGAPKCGTTALSEYLKTHKDIFISNPKEIHFFASDFKKLSCAKNLEEYISLFNVDTYDYKAIGEASVFHLYSDDAIENIYNFNKDAKIIVMLRSPIDYIYSYHSQALFAGNEIIEDFKHAWSMQKSRKLGNNIPSTCKSKKILLYKEASLFGEQVERLLNVFPKKQVHFILIDDLKKNVRQVYLEVLAFLDVKDDGKIDFEKVNENKKHRFKSLGKLRNNPPKGLISIVKKFKKVVGIENISLMKKIHELNREKVQREPLSQEFKKELLDEFIDDINKLEKLINRDLSVWKKLK